MSDTWQRISSSIRVFFFFFAIRRGYLWGAFLEVVQTRLLGGTNKRHVEEDSDTIGSELGQHDPFEEWGFRERREKVSRGTTRKLRRLRIETRKL